MAILKPHAPIHSPTLAQLQTARSSLQATTHILAGLTHRNKNQHRGTKWWAPFDMLRRSLNKLVSDLEDAIKRAEVLPSLSSSSKRKKAAADGLVKKAAKQPELARLLERAVWMREALAGRAYEAFAQLTADRQFAQLGLVLIGVLAQAEAAIAPLIPEPEEDLVPVQSELGADIHGEAVARSADFDLGVAVSRDELLDGDGDNVHPSIERVALPIPRVPPAKDTLNPDQTKDKKRKKLMTEEEKSATAQGNSKKRKLSREAEEGFSTMEKTADTMRSFQANKQSKPELGNGTSRTDKKSKPHTEEETQAAPKPKKKRKQKGGDEFDDLFSSLL